MVPGSDDLPQNVADNNIPESGQKISKWCTNTAENTGKIKNEADIPKSDYAYDNFSEEAQRNEFHTRYKDSKDVVGDIMKKDSLDAVDLRGAMDEWKNLMDEGSPESLSKANRLGMKISNQGREGGREIQVFAEQEMYKIYGSDIEVPLNPAIVITEDSKSGNEFFSAVCNDNEINCISAEGKSKVYEPLSSGIF